MPGSIGVAAAVVRNDELYLATVGPVEAYLIRGARLLVPDRSAPGGLPLDDSRPVEVWRGELDVGDALLLVSRNVTETVGTEELKSAVLTLHPQAAADHLHHLFVAMGGEGSDGLIVVEASEQTRTHRRVSPPGAATADDDLRGTTPPLVGRLAGRHGTRAPGWSPAATAPGRPCLAVSRAPPRCDRRRPVRRRSGAPPSASWPSWPSSSSSGWPSSSCREAATPGASSRSPAATPRCPWRSTGRTAPTTSWRRSPDAALDYYREAWTEVVRARNTGLSAPALDELERASGPDWTASTRRARRSRSGSPSCPRARTPWGLVEDTRGGAYTIDRASSVVTRVNTSTGRAATVVHEGDAPAAGGSSTIGKPVQIEAGGPDIVVVDDQARPWRWRPSNSAGAGTLNRLTLQGVPTFGEDHGDVAAYSPSTGGYRLYVAEPSRNQIMRYQQTLDGSAFSPPSTYLATPSCGGRRLRPDLRRLRRLRPARQHAAALPTREVRRRLRP